jgi:hypothetical protein
VLVRASPAAAPRVFKILSAPRAPSAAAAAAAGGAARGEALTFRAADVTPAAGPDGWLGRAAPEERVQVTLDAGKFGASPAGGPAVEGGWCYEGGVGRR